MDKAKVYQWLREGINEKNLLLNEPMNKHTSFKVGGPVDIMVLPENVKELQWVVEICRNEALPFLVIGNGTNLLVRDKGIREIIIKISHNLSEKSVKGTLIRALAGSSLSSVAHLAWKSGLIGLEFASGIPGALGGGVSMNAGAYGSEMKDVVKSIIALKTSGELVEVNNGDLLFEYRSSKVQKEENLIIVEVSLDLEPGDPDEILMKMRKLNKLRQLKQPLDFPNAGSTFKRPTGYYAGKLIEDAGLKGKRIGGAQVSRKHAGFLINLGYATSDDIIKLIALIRKTVEEKFGVLLEPEVKILGEP